MAGRTSSRLQAGVAAAWGMGLAVPGLTVPWNHAAYLWIATAISMAVHEVLFCHVLHNTRCDSQLQPSPLRYMLAWALQAWTIHQFSLSKMYR